jgi:hypothetical protein
MRVFQQYAKQLDIVITTKKGDRKYLPREVRLRVLQMTVKFH